MTPRNKYILTATIITVLVILAMMIPNVMQPSYQYSLSITGLVHEEVKFSLGDLKDLPNMTVRSEIICVSGQSFGTFNWTGVKLKSLLEIAGINESAIKIAFWANDSYSTDLPLQEAARDDIILAYQDDGNFIRGHVKLVVPGKWGYKWIDDVTRIELVDYDFRGYYESRGYSDDATINR